MAGLRKTEITARVVWLGVVPPAGGSLRSEPRDSLDFDFGGAAGEHHSGIQRGSCSRVTNLYPKGTRIMNVRQLSIVSAEELDGIAQEMGLAALDPALIGASIVVQGIPDFTHLPPSSRIQAASGATLTIDMENGPCVFPGREIEAEHPGFGARFKPAASGRRGVTAWVERPGALAVGDEMTLFIPDQRGWSAG